MSIGLLATGPETAPLVAGAAALLSLGGALVLMRRARA
jgi:LPXTG-motif cell wall-anchored protein